MEEGHHGAAGESRGWGPPKMSQLLLNNYGSYTYATIDCTVSAEKDLHMPCKHVINILYTRLNNSVFLHIVNQAL